MPNAKHINIKTEMTPKDSIIDSYCMCEEQSKESHLNASAMYRRGLIPRAFLVQGPWNEGRALVEGLDKASCVKSEKVFFLIIYII